jgi:hypothetical protein
MKNDSKQDELIEENLIGKLFIFDPNLDDYDAVFSTPGCGGETLQCG